MTLSRAIALRIPVACVFLGGRSTRAATLMLWREALLIIHNEGQLKVGDVAQGVESVYGGERWSSGPRARGKGNSDPSAISVPGTVPSPGGGAGGDTNSISSSNNKGTAAIHDDRRLLVACEMDVTENPEGPRTYGVTQSPAILTFIDGRLHGIVELADLLVTRTGVNPRHVAAFIETSVLDPVSEGPVRFSVPDEAARVDAATPERRDSYYERLYKKGKGGLPQRGSGGGGGGGGGGLPSITEEGAGDGSSRNGGGGGGGGGGKVPRRRRGSTIIRLATDADDLSGMLSIPNVGSNANQGAGWERTKTPTGKFFSSVQDKASAAELRARYAFDARLRRLLPRYDSSLEFRSRAMLIVAALGLLTAILEIELTWAGAIDRTVSNGIKTGTLALTIILLVQIAEYYVKLVDIDRVRWNLSARLPLATQPRYLNWMLWEMLVCVVHPPPQWWRGDDDVAGDTSGVRTSKATVLDERFSLFMFFRIYLLTRVLRDASAIYRLRLEILKAKVTRDEREGVPTRLFVFDWWLALKALFFHRPAFTVLMPMFIAPPIFAYCIFVSERAGRAEAGILDSNPLSYGDSLYLTLVTMTTVGYGDLSPVTDFGKLFAILSGSFGVVISSFVVAVTASQLAVSKSELFASNWVHLYQLRVKEMTLCASLIQLYFRRSRAVRRKLDAMAGGGGGNGVGGGAAAKSAAGERAFRIDSHQGESKRNEDTRYHARRIAISVALHRVRTERIDLLNSDWDGEDPNSSRLKRIEAGLNLLLGSKVKTVQAGHARADTPSPANIQALTSRVSGRRWGGGGGVHQPPKAKHPQQQQQHRPLVAQLIDEVESNDAPQRQLSSLNPVRAASHGNNGDVEMVEAGKGGDASNQPSFFPGGGGGGGGSSKGQVNNRRVPVALDTLHEAVAPRDAGDLVARIVAAAKTPTLRSRLAVSVTPREDGSCDVHASISVAAAGATAEERALHTQIKGFLK